mmetsp:Transcript_92884/g.179122  ORF Transcript_92884/g.179122 Transcript_92884/m.179122 type:complete len:214 (-) Transcript_92884:150-791(-)
MLEDCRADSTCNTAASTSPIKRRKSCLTEGCPCEMVQEIRLPKRPACSMVMAQAPSPAAPHARAVSSTKRASTLCMSPSAFDAAISARTSANEVVRETSSRTASLRGCATTMSRHDGGIRAVRVPVPSTGSRISSPGGTRASGERTAHSYVGTKGPLVPDFAGVGVCDSGNFAVAAWCGAAVNAKMGCVGEAVSANVPSAGVGPFAGGAGKAA